MSTTKPKIRSRKYEGFENVLRAKKDELDSRLNGRLGDVSIEREPDDEAALATRSFAKDLAIATLERERQTLAEIEAALQRMRTGRYAVCELCGNGIPEARLRALPWARCCVRCAEGMAVSSAA
jgi:RNA polymerase-binding transcription factor